MERARVREERRRRMNKINTRWHQVRKWEKAVEEAIKRAEEHHLEERKQRRREETMARRREQEWRTFQRLRRRNSKDAAAERDLFAD